MLASSICAIVPTYNRADMLRECIDSILAQSRPVQQLIVVNDGSTDHTEDIVRTYGDRVTLLSKPNGGKAAALNSGLAMCKCDYVWICDDDDVAAPSGVEQLASALDVNSDAGFAYGTFQIFRDGPSGRTYSPPTYWMREGEPNIHIQFLEEMFTFQYAMLVRRSSYEKVGPFREDLVRSQDHEMAIRLSRNAKAVYVPHVIFFQRVHEGQRGSAAQNFATASNAQKWLDYGQKVLTSIRKDYRLEEFTPTFARQWEPILAKRAALLERACISAERAMWAETISDLREAGNSHSSPASPQEIQLAEAVVRQALPWQILADNPAWKSGLNACYKANNYGNDIIHAACRPLVWHARKMFQDGDIGGGINMLRTLVGVLGVQGALRRIYSSLVK